MSALEIKESSVSIKGVQDYAEKVNEFAAKIGEVVPVAGNEKICADKVTEYRKAIKEGEDAVKSLMDAIERPVRKQLEPLISALADAKAKSSDYQKKVLVCKKEAFKAKAEEEYLSIVRTIVGSDSVSGEVPTFDSIYSESMYGMDLKSLHDSMLLKILQALKESSIVDDPDAKCALLIKGTKRIEKAKKALSDSGITFEEVKI